MDMAPVARGLDALRTCEKPVIAAVNGAALAGGFEVMMSCDLVVAVSHSKFGIPEVKRGLFAAGGGTRLPTRIPLTVALEMGMTGDPISPERALHLGLINQVVPADELHSATAALAARITANGPLAVRATKKLMHMEIPEANTKALGEATAQVFASEDAREGATAFAQKRAPEWKGR
jgi:enoyl-CoA hydratase/carnithine racemase